MLAKQSWLNLYPDQALCFWLGFISAGGWSAIFRAMGLNVLAVIFNDESMVQSLSDSIKVLVGFGITSGTLSLFIGYWLRNIQPTSPHRWLWLSFVISIFGCLVAGVQTDIEGFLSSGSYDFNHPLDDALFGFGIYALAGLAFGIIAVLVIGTGKLVRKLVRK